MSLSPKQNRNRGPLNPLQNKNPIENLLFSEEEVGSEGTSTKSKKKEEGKKKEK